MALVLFAMVVMGAVVIRVGRQGTRMGYESPSYKVVRSDGMSPLSPIQGLHRSVGPLLPICDRSMWV